MSFSSWFFRIVSSVEFLQPAHRRLFLCVADALLLPTSVWLSFWLRLATPWPAGFLSAGLWMSLLVCIVGLPLFFCTGQYKGLTRYTASSSLYRLAARNGLLTLIVAFIGVVLQLPMPPRSSWILLWLLITFFTGSLRFVLRDLILSSNSVSASKLIRVAIYGAGTTGAQLASSLRSNGSHQIIAFFDDDSSLWNRSVNGIPIYPSASLGDFSGSVDQLLFAIPSLPRSQRRKLFQSLKNLDVPVLQVPSLEDITSGRAKIDSLRPIIIEDLLGRDSVPPDTSLLGPGITNSIVCVTGAGGSIGSELCRQILNLRPTKLLIVDSSEPSLYLIEQELCAIAADSELVTFLGDSCNFNFMYELLSSHKVSVLFHAAAYKHVPLVELNPLAAILNNSINTRVVCNAALAACVDSFVLISTDKAVRPSNVMGASKRLAELVVQAFSQSSSNTRFSMVRFGNVLGSSGSVVPLFREQIKNGGPVTLTHPEIIRYFMTIPEAAQLVIQASVLAIGGDVFLLDMGDPVRILDLATQMINLSGLTVRDPLNPDGDIEILCTGLRPGEKLFEELLIDAAALPTSHPLIFRANEDSLPADVLWKIMDQLEDLVYKQDSCSALALLSQAVPQWKPRPIL